LTEAQQNGLVIVFPRKRVQLFEIYFVRLIGTPNQEIQKELRVVKGL
jgi:hypothetical protein